MISSILSMANNALIYGHRPVAARTGAAAPADGFSYREEQEVRETETSSVESRQPAQEDRFTASLAARLRETGVTGPDGAERIARVTSQAREIVSQIRREDGQAEANQAMAQILTTATGENADVVLAGIAAARPAPSASKPLPGEEGVPAETAEMTPEDLKASVSTPSDEEIARRAADKVADKAAEAQASPPPRPVTENAASAVRTALDEMEAFAPAAAKADVERNFMSLVNKAEAAGAYQAAPANGQYAQFASSAPRAYQAAYSANRPGPGSLLSVRV
jgi:hypothetical protein